LVKLECFEIISLNIFTCNIFKPKINTFFFQKACDLNDGSGCSFLGLMYKEGKGVKQDDFEIILFNAFAFFIHKSKIRATTARIQITRLLEKLEQDDFKALKFFQKACDLNDGSGCSLLGFMHDNHLV
jgi:TPR repeat protein